MTQGRGWTGKRVREKTRKASSVKVLMQGLLRHTVAYSGLGSALVAYSGLGSARARVCVCACVCVCVSRGM